MDVPIQNLQFRSEAVANAALEAARSLRETIDTNARKAGNEPVPAATVDALTKADLWGVMTPREVGGSELPLLDVIDVFEEVARADGSAGWCLMAGASTVAYFGAYAGDAFVQTLFANGVPLAAGQFAPNGAGVREDGGFRLSGRYQFGSGLSYAQWVGAGFLVPPPEGSDAPAEFRFALLPKDSVELRGNWDVLGLTSTASWDYSIDDAFVPEEGTFLFAAPTRRRGGPIYVLGVMALTASGHAGFALGVARRALDELTVLSKTKVRMGSSSFLKDSDSFLEKLGILESRFRAARAWVRESFAKLEADVVENGRVDPVLNNEVRQATVFVTQEAADVVRGAYLLAGTTALRAGPLERCFRDIHAGSQHFFASPASTLDMARDLVAAAPDRALDA
jgi:alkylation response protein AidB-like acyl-CoA dehydrogenase